MIGPIGTWRGRESHDKKPVSEYLQHLGAAVRRAVARRSVLFTSAGPRALAAAPAAVAASSSVLAAAPWADGGAPFGGMPVGIGIVVAPDVSELFHRAYVVRWERPIQFREVRTVVRHGASDTVVRQVWWRPWSELRVEEDHEQGRRIMLWNDDGHWMYDSRYPFVLHLESHRTAGPHGIGAEYDCTPPGRTAAADASAALYSECQLV